MRAPEIKHAHEHNRIIHIVATDNFEVTRVSVVLYENTGTLIENGYAISKSKRDTRQHKVSTKAIARVVITAYDGAGNTTMEELFIAADTETIGIAKAMHSEAEQPCVAVIFYRREIPPPWRHSYKAQPPSCR